MLNFEMRGDFSVQLKKTRNACFLWTDMIRMHVVKATGTFEALDLLR